MDENATPPIAVTHEAGLATIWLSRADRGNALGPDMVAALDKAIDAAVAGGARLVVLRGHGRNFCTGLDLSDLATLSDGDLALRVIGIELLLQKVHALPVTTLAIATGRVFGAGADLFAACDWRVALHGATFSFPGPAFGLVLGTRRLATLVGDAAARRMLLSGRVLPDLEAHACGLATELADADALDAVLDAAAAAAARLEPATVAALHARTRTADDDSDLAALVRSVARPGLRGRIEAYRAQTLAAPRPATAPYRTTT